MDADKIFSTQIGLMNEAASMLTDRASRLEPSPEEKMSSTDADLTLRLFYIRSLRLYKDNLEYLATQASDHEPRKHYYSLFYLRTLSDIYARFLHLLHNCPTEGKRAVSCLTYQLLTYRKLGDDSVYQQGLGIHKTLIQSEGVAFPANFSELSKTWADKNHLTFDKMSNLLDAKIIGRYSTDVAKIFPPQKPYEIYAHFSELAHGNPYYERGSEHNERFWLVSSSITNTAFLIELIDKNILGRGLAKDLRLWLSKIRTNKEEFARLWKLRTKELKHRG